jgi:hypothetical protein
MLYRSCGGWDEDFSGYGATEQPCIWLDQRTTDDPAKIPSAKGERDWWYADGSNHRLLENGNICRDFPTTRWFVEFEELVELLSFLYVYNATLDRVYNMDEWEIQLPSEFEGC